MTPRKGKGKAPPSRRQRQRMEFRAPSDGAWYWARVTVQCGALRVMYEEFTEDEDDWYVPASFASARDVAALRTRFRVASPALDDSQCRDLRLGEQLCVACKLDGGELKYYDAVLQSVAAAAHETVDGEERCACRFTVRWTEGPRAGTQEEVGIEQVCRVLSSPVQDPVLDEFLDDVTKLLGKDNSGATGSEAADAGSPRHAPPGFHQKYGTAD